MLQLDMCDICGLNGIWVLFPAQVFGAKDAKRGKEHPACHQACAALSKSVGRGPRAKFLGALVDKVFLGSTRKFSQRPWPCIFP